MYFLQPECLLVCTILRYITFLKGQFSLPALAVLPKKVLREGKCQETQMGDLVRCRIGCGLGGFTLTGDKFLKGNVSMTPQVIQSSWKTVLLDVFLFCGWDILKGKIHKTKPLFIVISGCSSLKARLPGTSQHAGVKIVQHLGKKRRYFRFFSGLFQIGQLVCFTPLCYIHPLIFTNL